MKYVFRKGDRLIGLVLFCIFRVSKAVVQMKMGRALSNLYPHIYSSRRTVLLICVRLTLSVWCCLRLELINYFNYIKFPMQYTLTRSMEAENKRVCSIMVLLAMYAFRYNILSFLTKYIHFVFSCVCCVCVICGKAQNKSSIF